MIQYTDFFIELQENPHKGVHLCYNIHWKVKIGGSAMRRLIDPEVMRVSEAEYFRASGVPSIEVMERAARALSDAALERFPGAWSVHIACGPGGNGGDGYACARLLRAAGRDVRVFAASPAKSPDAAANAARARACGIPILEAFDSDAVPDLWIDCLYGTGLSRAPHGAAAELIARMNRDRAAGAKIAAADIPSGLDGRTGARFEPCIEADLTVSFQYAKYGHVLQDGLDACGELFVRDVGFPPEAFPADLPSLVEPRDLRSMFAPRRRNIHKGSCGHLLIVAGSAGMAGAAALCARAALRGGAGLVSIACPGDIVPILQTLAPCAMCIPLPQRDGAIAPEAVETVCAALAGKTAVTIGPGLSRRAPAALVAAVLESGLPAAIDADALNLIAENPEQKALLRLHHILTPHPGEAARLLGRPCGDPVAGAEELSSLGATAVLKGASRVIAGRSEIYVSASGAGGMARGGSGDVYAGLLGALLAEKSGRTPAQSAAAACELHGLAGARAQAKYGPRGMNAADIIEFLPEVFREYVD